MFGAYLLDDNGLIYYENGADILSFKEKISVVPSLETQEIDLRVSGNMPVMPFVKVNTNALKNLSPYLELRKTSYNNWSLFVKYGKNEHIDIYVFSVNVYQQQPQFGMALFNENGDCLLTNETKRLNMNLCGEVNSIKADITLNGSYAIFPQFSGVIIWRGDGITDNRSYDSDVSYLALYNGYQTRIHGQAIYHWASFMGGSGSMRDSHITSLYINTAPYD